MNHNHTRPLSGRPYERHARAGKTIMTQNPPLVALPIEPIELLMYPMQYDKLTCTLPLASIPGHPANAEAAYDQLANMLRSTWPNMYVKHFGGNSRIVAYFNQGVHLFSIDKTSYSANLLLTLYGANSWDMSRWVLKELGNLKVIAMDICIDYTGSIAWASSAYKIEILASKWAQTLNEDVDRVLSPLVNSDSRYKPRSLYTRLNGSTRIKAYEKGRKMMNDIHAMVPGHRLLDAVDASWVRIELQSRNIGRQLRDIQPCPVAAWMDVRGDQEVMDKLFWLERDIMLHGGCKVANLRHIGELCVTGSRMDMDQVMLLRCASQAEQDGMARLYADYFACKDVMLRALDTRSDTMMVSG